MVLIYIIRHGETDMNTSGKVNDANIDTSINDKGKKQAKKTGEYLKKVRKLNGSNCVIYTSPAMRAVQTATIIKNEINRKLKMQSDERLLETSKGVLSGLSKTDKLNKKYSNDIDKALKKGDTLHNRERITDVLNNINPKYGVEPIAVIKKRVVDFFNNLPMDKPNVVIVTHAGIVTSILIHVMRIMQIINGDQSRGKNCTITTMEKTVSKKNPIYTLLTFPNTEHL